MFQYINVFTSPKGRGGQKVLRHLASEKCGQFWTAPCGKNVDVSEKGKSVTLKQILDKTYDLNHY